MFLSNEIQAPVFHPVLNCTPYMHTIVFVKILIFQRLESLFLQPTFKTESHLPRSTWLTVIVVFQAYTPVTFWHTYLPRRSSPFVPTNVTKNSDKIAGNVHSYLPSVCLKRSFIVSSRKWILEMKICGVASVVAYKINALLIFAKRILFFTS